ncbi:peptidase A22B signal peptide peptidase [Pyrrhoderma noxium]|uniref:Peptidase A22B signal peptide peptidase n=1 Tax=Pyrrhoderma noxium TaxID=2282107 RepID=A0A286UGI6_9AGAM|nr:peptidase A22B signal peptide peptidase [Pyrrhoderma noxium]
MSQQDWHLISSYAGILILATFSVYAGSFGSLKAPRSAKGKKDSGDDDSEQEDEEVPERVTTSEALLFPILGSITLFGLYLIVKFLGVEWINWLLGWYFAFVGIISVWKCSISIAVTLLGKGYWRSFKIRKLELPKFIDPKGTSVVSMRTPSIVLLFPSLIPSILYSYQTGPKKSALITDILALSFAHNSLSLIKLDRFQTGIILLSGLFLYDIWWVFGTEVMVTVGTSLDAPIKILWPKSYLFSIERGFTMLGLGDIVVPGLFISLALRFDLNNSAHKTPNKPFIKPYFISAIIAYVVGLSTTIVVMSVFKAAQPALLYLSPACILSFLITAYSRNELNVAWEWDDNDAKPAEEKEPVKDICDLDSNESVVLAEADPLDEEYIVRNRLHLN